MVQLDTQFVQRFPENPDPLISPTLQNKPQPSLLAGFRDKTNMW